MKRDGFKFLSGFMSAMTFVHVFYAIATRRGTAAVPMWRGHQWGVGKMLIEAVVYGSAAIGLGYLGWRPAPRSSDRM